MLSKQRHSTEIAKSDLVRTHITPQFLLNSYEVIASKFFLELFSQVPHILGICTDAIFPCMWFIKEKDKSQTYVIQVRKATGLYGCLFKR